MNYDAKTKLREDVVKLIKEINPGAKIDGKTYDVLADFTPSRSGINSANYLETMELAQKIIKALIKMPNLKPGLTENEIPDFQFEGPGASIMVNVGREGVGIFLMEEEHDLVSRPKKKSNPR